MALRKRRETLGTTNIKSAMAATTHPTAWRNPASDACVLQTSDALGAAAVQLGSQAVAWISVLNKHSTTHRPGGLYEP